MDLSPHDRGVRPSQRSCRPASGADRRRHRRMYEPRSDHATGDVTFLEMTSPEQLQPASEPSSSLDLEEIDPSAAPVVRATYVRIGTPLSWSGRMAWSEEDWRGELSRPEVRAWIAR